MQRSEQSADSEAKRSLLLGGQGLREAREHKLSDRRNHEAIPLVQTTRYVQHLATPLVYMLI